MKTIKFWLGAAPLTLLILSGCGGGARAGLSGPNSNTRPGLGTLFVRVESATGGAVADNAATVALEKNIGVVRGGRAAFYNLAPGRYFVQARSQAIGLPGDSRNVDVEADKTRTITLKLSPIVAPTNPANANPF